MFTKLTYIQKSVIFIALVLVITYGAIFIKPIGVLSGSKQMLFVVAPALIAFFMLMVVSREGYTRAGWKELGLHRFGFRLWWFGLLIPTATLGIGYVIVWTTGIDSLSVALGTRFYGVVITVVLYIALNIAISMGEEIGWRGYLLPKLIPLGRSKALWISGLVWAVFHYPLILFGGYDPHGNRLLVLIMFTITVLAIGFIIGELRLRTGSVWVCSLFHSTHNVIWNILLDYSRPHGVDYVSGESGIVSLVLYSAVAIWMFRSGSKRDRNWQTEMTLTK